MALKRATEEAQTVLEAEFRFRHNDTMVDVAGVTKDFGLTQLSSSAFDIIGMPPGYRIIGGEVVTETAFDTTGYDILVGDADVTNRYLASTDRALAGRTELTPTGFRGEKPIRFTFASDDVCTAGEMVIRVWYVIDNRANENN